MADTLALSARLGAFFLTTMGLLTFVGYGPAALLLPPSLRRSGWLLAPRIG